MGHWNYLKIKVWTLFLIPLLIHCSSQPPVSRQDETAFQIGVVEGDTRAEVLKNQAFEYYLRGDFLKAAVQLETSNLIDSQSVDAWGGYLLYYCYLAVGDYREALKLAEKIVKEEPYDPLSYQQVGIAQLWLGETDAAVENFKRTLDFEAHFPRVHFYLSIAYSQLKHENAKEMEIQKGQAEYEQILKKNPFDFLANYELAALQLFWDLSLDRTGGLLSAAKESLQRSSEEDLPQEKRIYAEFYLPVLEGILNFRRGKYQSSLETLFRTLGSVPSGSRADLAEVYYYIGQNYASTGDATVAKTFFNKVLAVDPRGPHAFEIKSKLATEAAPPEKKI